MDDSTANPAPAASQPRLVTTRAEKILLKLLDGVESDIETGALPSKHMEAYEALCRAERARSGV